MPSAPLALWVLGCFSLLLWLWALCTACHRYVSALSTYGSKSEVLMRALPVCLPWAWARTFLCPLD